MKNIVRDTKLFFGKLDRRFIQLFFLVLALSLFALGAGAPGASGGIGAH